MFLWLNLFFIFYSLDILNFVVKSIISIKFNIYLLRIKVCFKNYFLIINIRKTTLYVKFKT